MLPFERQDDIVGIFRELQESPPVSAATCPLPYDRF